MVEKREKILLFYNPHSGSGMFRNNLDLIIREIQEHGYQTVPVRSAKGKAIETAMSEMDQNMYKQIIVAGGDGTINICVNAMIRHNINLPLAIFPTGTANDFAYYFDMPVEIEEMVEVALNDHYTYADVGVCNNKYFINVAALGMLVDVSQKTDPNLKNTLGVFAYYLKGFTEITTLKPIPVTLTTPKKTYKENMFFMVVMNGRSAGGFKKISPSSEINDGELDVILFREMPVLELGPLLVQVLQGSHPKHKKVLSFKSSEILIESPQDISTDVDGELGEKLPLRFSVLHNRLKIHTPDEEMLSRKRGFLR